MKLTLPALLMFFFPFAGLAQNGENKSHPGYSHSISAGVLFPLGEFSETHLAGAAFFYNHSSHRYGRMESLPSKRFGFTYGGGVAWHPGKKETVGLSYTYQYPDHTYAMTYGGVMFLPCRQGNIAAIAGPAVSFYSGDKRFNLFGGLTGEYFPWERIGFGGGLKFLKEEGSAWRSVAGVNLKYVF